MLHMFLSLLATASSSATVGCRVYKRGGQKGPTGYEFLDASINHTAYQCGMFGHIQGEFLQIQSETACRKGDVIGIVYIPFRDCQEKTGCEEKNFEGEV